MPVNVENVQKVIDYYKTRERPLTGWGYSDCACAAFKALGVIHDVDEYFKMTTFLGMPPVADDAPLAGTPLGAMIGGPGSFVNSDTPPPGSNACARKFYGGDGEVKRHIAIQMFEHFRDTGDVVWAAPKN